MEQTPELSWDQVLSWRLGRQFLTDRDAAGTAEVVRRLAGVQAQVASCAEQAVAVRRADRRSGVSEALDDRSVLRTWAMRGTLHLLAADRAPAVLSLLAAARTWEKGAWQKEFAPAATMAALAEAVDRVLAETVLTRDELVEALEDATDRSHEHLRSGWGVLLKPLAWQGLLVNGPPRGTRPTFTHPRTWVPGWPGLPDPDEAARVVIPAYLGAHGPASPETFDAWLLRGATPKRRLRGWFADLVDAGVLTRVDVRGHDEPPGTTRYARVADLDALADAVPPPALRLLPGFDQYVLGPGTTDTHVVPAAHRPAVSRAAGWIAPVVVGRGRVTGTWSVDDDVLVVEPFAEAPAHADLDGERAVWSAVLGRTLRG